MFVFGVKLKDVTGTTGEMHKTNKVCITIIDKNLITIEKRDAFHAS